MGLAIVQTIVDAHCGLIETFNDPAGGAAFVITFPIAKNDRRIIATSISIVTLVIGSNAVGPIF